MSEYKFLEYTEENNTAIIKINRPEVYNALSMSAKFEIIRALRNAGKSSEVRSIILTAEGKAFCTGQDLNDRTVQSNGGSKVDLGHTLETEWNPLVQGIRSSKKPVIGAINGVVAGAGVSVALACDLIVAAPGIKFISGFSKLGLCPDAGSSHTFVRALGYQRTMEFFLFNEPLTSEDLYGAGLVNQVEDDYLDVAKTMAQKINGLSMKSTALIKKNLQNALDTNYNESILNETYSQRFLGASKEYQEGLSAFFEKRNPDFYKD